MTIGNGDEMGFPALSLPGLSKEFFLGPEQELSGLHM